MHPGRKALPGDMAAHRLSLAHLHCSLQDLVVGNVTGQPAAVIKLPLMRFLPCARHLTSSNFYEGRNSVPTLRMECGQDTCECLSRSLNPDLLVLKPVLLITTIHYQLAFSIQTRLVTFQIKTSHIEDRCHMWSQYDEEEVLRTGLSLPQKSGTRGFASTYKCRCCCCFKHQIVGYGKKSKIPLTLISSGSFSNGKLPVSREKTHFYLGMRKVV